MSHSRPLVRPRGAKDLAGSSTEMSRANTPVGQAIIDLASLMCQR
ncbi:hypothetical protein MPS_5284 [Mycobacterium pseudoshottsii JCM 15466]|nr:hypothetical protein MPS_5284 [Mycobacterium pseudoshottsii JCM 15466]